MRILLVEDDKIMRITLSDAIQKKGYQVVACATGADGIAAFKKDDFDVVLTDLKLPRMSGLDILKKAHAEKKNTPVIIMTAYSSVSSAVEALKLGAYDYLTKPFSLDELFLTLKKIEDHLKIIAENIQLKKELRSKSGRRLIGNSAAHRKIIERIEMIAESNHTVLIHGESGTGKEGIANLIHYNSLRKDAPFIKVSCAALSETLLESELFGHEKGAFTGAIAMKKGRFERANAGTIFLDDVDDTPLSMQVKLLRVLQEREFERVGGHQVIPIDVRVICATKVNLLEKVQAHKFREDLFYRLNVIPIQVPPLREKKEDIPLLIQHFIQIYGKADLSYEISSEAMDLFLNYSWPGNVRELENIIQRILALAQSTSIVVKDLPEVILQYTNRQVDFINWKCFEQNPPPLENLVLDFERKLLIWALEKTQTNQTHAAQLLQIKRSTLRSKLEKFGLLKSSE